MKLIIDIPDILMKYIVNGKDLSEEQNDEMALAIANGTPLPKGHGRLIDADALDLEKEVSMADDWKTAHEIANCVKYAPTIIEADKAESEDKE